MSSIYNLIPQAINPNSPDTFFGIVSTRQPSPQSFTDPLYVVIPGWDTDTYFEIDDWPAIHGASLPPAGNAVMIQKDDQGNWRCVWWSGTTNFTDFPDGITLGWLGGDVSGTTASATVSTVLGGQTPLYAGSAAGGALTGTYPNPTLAQIVRCDAMMAQVTILTGGAAASPVLTLGTNIGGWTLGSGNKTIVCPEAGLYDIKANVRADGPLNATAYVNPILEHNGSLIDELVFDASSGSSNTIFPYRGCKLARDAVLMAVGDTISLLYGASSTGTVIFNDTGWTDYIQITRRGDS